MTRDGRLLVRCGDAFAQLFYLNAREAPDAHGGWVSPALAGRTWLD